MFGATFIFLAETPLDDCGFGPIGRREMACLGLNSAGQWIRTAIRANKKHKGDKDRRWGWGAAEMTAKKRR